MNKLSKRSWCDKDIQQAVREGLRGLQKTIVRLWPEYCREEAGQKKVLTPQNTEVHPSKVADLERPLHILSKNSPWIDVLRPRKNNLHERILRAIEGGIEYNNQLLKLSRELREVLKTTNGAG